MSEFAPHFSSEYIQHITQDYGDGIADQLQLWRLADLPEQSGEFVRYVRLNANADPDRRPLLFIQGYAAGIIANATFGAEMASRGYDIILSEQHRGGCLAPLNTATGWQARNTMAVVEAEGLTQTPLDVVTHSYGSLIFDELEQRSQKAGWHSFDNSKVAMLAPTGVLENEQIPDFMKRFLSSMTSGKSIEKFPDSYWEQNREMVRAGFGIVMSNLGRAGCEGWRIMRDRVNFDRLLQTVGEIAIVPFGQDPLFPADKFDDLPFGAHDGRLTAFVPYSLLAHESGGRGIRGAEHNDLQFNPPRVGAALHKYLQLPRQI